MAMKKLNYTLTVYKNTGFNGLDIPQSPAVLENATKQTYNDVYYLREDIDLPQIQVNDNYHNLADVDYVKLTSNDVGSPSYYYFAIPHAMAGGTTRLALQLDALTTMGGAGNLDYISGWQERGHIAKSEDALFENIAPEDWSPSQPLKNSQYQYVNTDGGVTGVVHPANDLQIIITNIDLIALGKYIASGVPKNIIEVIKGGTIDPNNQDLIDELMYIPKISSSEHHTVFRMMSGTEGSSSLINMDSLTIPNTCAYDVTNPIVRNGLDLLFSCGQLQLQGSYTIPKEYIIQSLSGTDMTYQGSVGSPREGQYIEITGNLSFATISALPFEYTEGQYTPKNKKVFSMFRSYTLTNPASGSMITLPVYELKKGNNTAPVVRSWSDPTSTGKPNAKFDTDLSANVPFSDVVSGSNWINNQLLMEGASGSLWNNLNASLNQQSIQRGFEQEMYNAQVSLANAGMQDLALTRQKYTEQANFAVKTGASVAGLFAGGAGGKLGAGVAVASIGNLATAGMAQENMYLNQAIAQQQLENQMNQIVENAKFSEQAYEQNVNENRVGLLKSNGVVAPTPYFTPEPNLAMYGYNKFVIYETKLQENDLKSLDDYFQRYGYNGIHRKLEQACFNCRQYYCYVQAFDVNIKAVVSYGLRIRNRAIGQLNGGVRVWKVLPDAQYYETN